MKIIDDKIVIAVEKPKTIKGLYVPETMSKRGVIEGEVHQIGPGRYYPDGIRRVVDVKIGDRVIFNNAGAAIKVDIMEGETQKQYFVIQPQEILMVLDENEHQIDTAGLSI